MIPTFVIFLREGIEAAMIVAILLAYLKRVGQRHLFRDVYWGVAAAFALIFAGGIAAYLLIKQYDGSNVQTYFETGTYLLAAAILTYMTFWMQSHARGLSGELQQKSDLAISKGGRFGLALLAFQAVGREGLETMVFTLAIVFANSKQAGTPIEGNLPWIGAILGLVTALAIAFGIYRMGARVNLRLFFRVLGVALIFFAAGLLADAVQNMQELNWLPFMHHELWNSSGFIAEGSNFGDLLHSLLGYAERPTTLQALVWIVYLVAGSTFFIRMGKRKKPVSV
jgi:high-affinity iron transporter